jgi:hypothetical protein
MYFAIAWLDAHGIIFVLLWCLSTPNMGSVTGRTAGYNRDPQHVRAGWRNVTYTYPMSPKLKFNFMIEPGQLAALKAIEARVGATVGEQIRRAIAVYLESQTVVPKGEIRKILAARA